VQIASSSIGSLKVHIARRDRFKAFQAMSSKTEEANLQIGNHSCKDNAIAIHNLQNSRGQ
jgi:hypothetical protein